jgi:hypothetical protein
MRADAYGFKFRMPYGDAPGADGPALLAAYARAFDLRRAAGAARVDLREPGARAAKPGHIDYLDGELYLQAYGRPMTGEVRLLGFREDDGSYRLRRYAVGKHEAKMAVFNAAYRGHALFDGFAAAGYDAAAELHILRSCSDAGGDVAAAVASMEAVPAKPCRPRLQLPNSKAKKNKP